MLEAEVIIVGAGPAGSACAWKLNQNGMQTVLLDKRTFPRRKLCAGWITPGVLKNLEIQRDEYPHGILTFKRLFFHIRGKTFRVPTCQYSIRRTEFDHWMLKRAAVPLQLHTVQQVRKEDGYYIVDNSYRSKYLVGAAGTYCPVYRSFFKESHLRSQQRLIVAIEEEFKYDYHDANCHLWFFDNNLPGYAWYVPKADGYLNVGIGGKFLALKNRGQTIRQHWDYFIARLEKLSMVKGHRYRPRGHNYYLRQPVPAGRFNNAYIVGDAAGLATLDLGEGIGPAIESGILAAESILTGGRFSERSVTRYSLHHILWAGLKRTIIGRAFSNFH
ncbi:MAG: NAD(P)/FAD-dependent oxidoreductase [Deltaproteobacteria bacterium]|jgi:flavin-dependent dehydrogenase|nr:NAD(P)/FAD-dependent oxidoreductase [Deltaproteobacteria bacterium]